MAGKSQPRDSGTQNASTVTKKRALWTPQPGPQANAICADWCPLLFYGGGKYSGKTDYLLGDYLQDLDKYREHWQGIIFRRSLTEFTEMKLRADELFPQIGGEWYEQKSEWRFPRYGRKVGDKLLMPILRFRYLENLKDIRMYEGHSYPWIGVDELGDWEDPDAFFRLLTLNRYGRAPIPTKRVRATGNPGGRGHQWVSEYFVEPAPQGSKILYDETLKQKYLFILGTYRDNKIGMQNDPGYADRMNRAGSPALVRALKEGDFSVVAGAFFKFTSRNIITPFELKPHWTKYMSMDYGSCGGADPFSIGWYVVVSEDYETNEGIILPKGHIIQYREWYGQGLPKITVKFLADGIKAREKEEQIQYRVAGGDIQQKRGTGPSVFEMLSNEGLIFKRADNRRVPGWLLMNDMLDAQFPRPGLSFFSTCIKAIKIIPAAQHDMHDGNELEQANDHIPEQTRYSLTSRSWPAAKKVESTVKPKQVITFNELLEQNEQHDY